MPKKAKRRIRNEGRTKNETKKKSGGRGRYFNLFTSENVKNSKESLKLLSEKIGTSNKDHKEKPEKELKMVLDIPLVVIARVISNIREIENLSEKNKMPLIKAQSFVKTDHETKASLASKWMLTGIKRSPVETLDFIPVGSNKKSKKNENECWHAKEQSVYVGTIMMPSPEETPEFISLKPETKCEINSESMVPKMDTPDISFNTKAPNKIHESIKTERNLETDQPKPSTSRQYMSEGVNTEINDEIICLSDNELKYDIKECKTTFSSIKPESKEDIKHPTDSDLLLKTGSHYKYGYNDIITGTFDEKLNENLAKSTSICANTPGNDCLSIAFHEEFQDMITRPQFKEMMVVREKLPAFQKSTELLNVIENNQVIVISGETGCGKSTQVPQIILDSAICQNKGANTHILVTQPRRIAASSLAIRVAQERAEKLGNSVGYAVRLEKSECRPVGSIMYVTTGILLADLEVNQGLTNYSHIILDEAHERDSHLDLSMCMLKQVLKKRSDLKLILMSATMDTRRLRVYFGHCPEIHLGGRSYPVQQFYLEDVLTMTGYKLPPDNHIDNEPSQDSDINENHERQLTKREKDMQYKNEVGFWLRNIKGRLDPVVYSTLEDRRIEKLNIDLVMALLIHISRGPPGAVLVFLPGIHDIYKLIRIMNESRMFPSSNYQIYPLHSKLCTTDQHKIFKRPPQNIRKIIIATNIAETSITIDDIVYVVDSGRVKMKGLNVERNISTLKTEFASKTNLKQRRGRAGRCQPGIAYHLITSYRFQNTPYMLKPELQRSNLLEPLLQIKKLRLGKAQVAFKLVPDPPADFTVKKAVQHLQQCGALDDEERLTPLGWHLARLPLHPAAGKLLLLGALFGCVERAAAVAAVWGFKDPFNLVFGKEQEITKAKRALSLAEPSDHIAISEAIIQWEQLDREQQSQFAYDHFLSDSTLRLLCQMKKQLCDSLRQMGFLASKNVHVSWENRNAGNLCVFKAIVAAALYPNVGIVRWTNLQNSLKQQKIIVSTPEDGRVQLHPSSIMHATSRPPVVPLCDKPGANWLVYWMKQKSSELFLFEVTLVFTLPLLLFGELEVSEVEDSPEECFLSVSSVKVRCLKGTADVIFRLRTLLDQVLASMVEESSDRSTRYSEFDNLVFKAVIDLMTLEDERPEGLEDESYTDSDSDCEIVDSYNRGGDIIVID